eukprot:EG_transcript_26065
MHAYAALMLLGKHRRRPYSLPQATHIQLNSGQLTTGPCPPTLPPLPLPLPPTPTHLMGTQQALDRRCWAIAGFADPNPASWLHLPRDGRRLSLSSTAPPLARTTP